MNAILVETGLAGAIGTGIVFVEAGLAKLRHRELVPGVVANYRLLPEILVTPVAAMLPWTELALGLALVISALTGGMLRGAALPAAGLLMLFAAAMAINIGRGRRHIDCGCGRSQLRQSLNWGMVLRNLALAALVLLHALPAPGVDRAGLADLAVATVAGLSLFLLTLLFNALSALATSPLAGGRR